MTAKKKPLPTIDQRSVIDGYVHTFDRDGRECLDIKNRERITLVHDLRAYGNSLHIGALGWTVPETTDGYKVVEVLFDSGQRLCLNRYAFERVDPESADAASIELVKRYRNTRFDADYDVASACRAEWITKYYGGYMNLASTLHRGVGDQELYAFTFPTLKELSTLKGESYYPVKIGFSKNSFDGAFGRIRSQIFEKAAYPEKPEVLLVWKTWDGRDIETQVHKQLRTLGRKSPASLGKEWFYTSTEELHEIISQCDIAALPSDRVICGADETIEEGFEGLMAGGATIEMGMVPGQAAVRIGVRYPQEEGEQGGQLERR